MRLTQFLRNHGTPRLAELAFKIRKKLPGLIDDVWEWETVGDALSFLGQSRVERLQRAAEEP